MSSTPLAALERSRLEFGAAAAEAKLALLKQLVHTRLGSARAVMRLHEALCFIRAYPDNATVLAQVQTMLAAFDRRSDLRAHRLPLADSGIAGTAMHYRFFAGRRNGSRTMAGRCGWTAASRVPRSASRAPCRPW